MADPARPESGRRRGRPAGGNPPSGVKSLEAALGALTTLADMGGPCTLTALGQASGLGLSACHRYLASFASLGLVRQGADGRYELGPGALSLGLAALQRLDPVALAGDALPALADEAGATALLSVWSPAGPTIIRWQRGGPPFATALGLGSVLPAERSATGLAFIAHLPKPAWRDLVGSPIGPALRADIRKRRMAHVSGTVIPGLRALSAPVLDLQGEAVLAITLIGADRPLFDLTGPAARTLDRTARRLSQMIGGPE